MGELTTKQKNIIMAAVMSAMFFAAINMTIISTALPKIVSQIGGMDYFNWVFTIYMLASTVTAMLVGKLSDMFGRKIFILIGIVVFMIGTFLCGMSTTIFHLIIFRGIQGFGGGMIMSTAFTTVGDLFTSRERGRWQGLLGSVWGLSSLIGPTLGGYIIDNLAWNWIFWVFLPIGIVAFFCILKLYPSQDRQAGGAIDYGGATVLIVTVTSLLLGFSWAGTEYDWLSVPIIGLFLFSLISGLVFVMIERRVENPVIPLHLFKNDVFTISIFGGMLQGMGMFGLIMYIPFFVQGVMGESATASGLVEMVMTVAMVSCSTYSGYLITKTGKYKRNVIIGLAVMAVGLFLNSLLTVESTMLRLVLQLILTGVGLGMTMPVFNVTVQNAVKHKYLGVATSTMQVFRQIGATISVTLMGTLMGFLMSRQLMEQMAENEELSQLGSEAEQLQNPQILMDASQLDQIKQALPEHVAAYFEPLIAILRGSLSYALTGVFLALAFVIVLSFIVVLFLREIPLKTTNNDEENPSQAVKERE